MSIEEIKSLPVKLISAPNCFLFLWVTFPLLNEGLQVIESWGFEFKSIAFNWIKLNKKTPSLFWGMGNYTRCLKGDTKIYLLDKNNIIKIEQIKNLSQYALSKTKIWSPTGWKRIYDFVENKNTWVNEIKTPVGTLTFSDSHTLIYKEPIARRLDSTRIAQKRKNEKRKIEHVIKYGSFEQFKVAMSKTLVKENGHSVNLLFSQTPIEKENQLLQVNNISLTKDIAWVLGLFCAEGSYNGTKEARIQFSLHSKEQRYFKRIKTIIELLGLKNERYFNTNVKVGKFVKDNSMSVYLSSLTFKKFIQQFIIGTNAHTKRLNLELLLQTSIEFRHSFWQGMFDGDGHKSKRRDRKLFLCNKGLVEDFAQLLHSIGIATNIYLNNKPQYKNDTLCYKYGLSLMKQNRMLKFKEFYRTLTTQAVQEHISQETTYDISVEGELFIANDIVSHNSNSEICLLGVKGKPKIQSHSVHSIVMSPIERHSKKPDIVRDKIVELCGDVPRIELFARETTNNWHAWGNEVWPC